MFNVRYSFVTIFTYLTEKCESGCGANKGHIYVYEEIEGLRILTRVTLIIIMVCRRKTQN